jgi:hypothetical protein
LPGFINRETQRRVLFSDIRKRDCIICGNVSLWNIRHVTDERFQYAGTTRTCAREGEQHRERMQCLVLETTGRDSYVLREMSL